MRSKGQPKIASEEPEDSSIFYPQPCLAEDSLVPVLEGDWKSLLMSKCTFSTEIFSTVMLNLIKNPNIMSSHLFRADILYDSATDASTLTNAISNSFTKHMRKEYQPVSAEVAEYEWQRTFVRQLVPRNRQLDKDLIQSCHIYTRKEGLGESFLVLYIPHVATAEEMPWYHPQVRQLAFLYRQPHQSEAPAFISIHYCPFPDHSITERLERTALQILRTIHKHGQGQKRGYVKRVHHDQVVPQQRFQDTYARLKATYAKTLIGDWVEQTDPTKHVFEDLGIAAFLLELWADMYDRPDHPTSDSTGESDEREAARPKFPGFVDIGCGNGVLINILIQEGYTGWGFDARRRKTWDTFPPEVQSKIKEMVLVPQILYTNASDEDPDTTTAATDLDRHTHTGVFPPGTFIISNHADELTAWTPLLGYVNSSPFIAIPCCSHDLAGSRFRAPSKTRSQTVLSKTAAESSVKMERSSMGGDADVLVKSQAAETGSLKKPDGVKQVSSAYATLCSYVSGLATELGFEAEKEMLRIPSTRNACVVGRKMTESCQGNGDEKGLDKTVEKLTIGVGDTSMDDSRGKREEIVRNLVERELGMSLAIVGEDWIKRAKMILGKKGDGH